MLYIRGRSPDTRQAWSRRDMLRVGLAAGAGLAGGLPLLNEAALANPAGDGRGSFGRAKSLVLVYLFGGPSHIDMWDMKPDAPSGIRGEFHPIETNVPGIEITEHLPLLARCADQYSIIRSMTHGDSSHGSASHTMLTGRRPRNLGEVPPREDDFPNYGAVLGKLRPTAPEPRPSFRIRGTSRPAPMSCLARTADSWASHSIRGASSHPRQQRRLAGPTFDVPLANLPEGVDPRRLLARRRLLEDLATSRAGTSFTELATIYERAFDLLLSPKFLEAFRVEREPASMRERYGQNVFGQSLLLARRLVESGVRTTVVYWPDRSEPEAFNNNGVVDKVAVAAWDTHGHHVGNTPNFPRLKDHNLPPLDRGLTAFLGDLAERGLLDETLVAVTGESAARRKINGDAGRDHYGNVFSAILAGGGV